MVIIHNRRIARHLFIIPLITLLILFADDILCQGKYIPSIRGEFPRSVFVVTNRLLEITPGGRMIYSNEIDTLHGLKYLKVTLIDEEWFVETYDSLDMLLENPAPYHDWAIWVHGDGQSFLLSMKRALEIQYLHRVNFIVFAWPTKAPDKGPIGNFKNSMDNARLTSPYFRELFLALQDYRKKPADGSGDEKLSILIHSLGNYALKLALEKGLLADLKPDLFDNIILNAPAVESEGHNKWVEELDLQERIYVCYNDEDINLEGLRVISSFGVQLGERPVGPLAGNATYFDFTQSVGSRTNTGATHSYYYALIPRLSENIRGIYYDLLHGKEINTDNSERLEHTANPKIFQIRF